MDGFIEIFKPYINILIIGAGGAFLAIASSKLFARLLLGSMGAGWSRFIGSLIALAISVWTIKLILDVADAKGLLVVLITVLTAAFALGSDRVAADLVSGVSLFFSRPYQVGDIVSIAGQEGSVRAISITQTTLESLFGDQIYIRNSDVESGTIVNYSATPGHLITSLVILPATEDLNLALEAIEKSIQGFSPEMAGSPYRSSVSAESGEPGYFNIEVHMYVAESLDYGPEKTRLFLRVTNALKEAGISLAPID
ncbi:MAG: mechanosensitive ion channel family protein [Anaerolineales bacterium]|nr:mechanosensitive ion channel family protein [Anaerolineales bacterium]